jgi:hypothetical protein
MPDKDSLTYPVGKKVHAVRVGPSDAVIYFAEGGQLIVESWIANEDSKKGSPYSYLTAKVA